MGVVYRLIGRRFSTLLVTGAGAAFAFDMTFNRMTNAYWDYVKPPFHIIIVAV